MMIRLFSSYPEGVSFAILIMNLTVPHIDRYTRRSLYGGKVGKRDKRRNEKNADPQTSRSAKKEG
jgi:hypothetical protein